LAGARVSVDEFTGAGNSLEALPAGEPVPLPAVARGVSLWWFRLDAPVEGVAPFAAHLSTAEHARAARFGTDLLRTRYIVGRSVLRRLLGALLDIGPDAVPIQRGRRGRPELRDVPAVDFNVSHTHEFSLVGIAHARGEDLRIGVDIECTDRDVGADRLARKFLTARESAALAALGDDARRRRFLHHWTCKEAMSKATGDGLAAPFRQLDVDTEGAPRLVGGPPPYVPAAWSLHPVTVPGFYATLAIWRGVGREDRR
jgi:4'-phosphopantetheinyl transferase